MNTLVIPGNPIPKERARTVRGHSFTPQRTARQEKLIRTTALAAGIKPISDPLRVEMWFYRDSHRRGDVSNMIKLAEDALNGVAWEDDNQIIDLVGHKRYDKTNPRTEIHWETLSLTSPAD